MIMTKRGRKSIKMALMVVLINPDVAPEGNTGGEVPEDIFSNTRKESAVIKKQGG